MRVIAEWIESILTKRRGKALAQVQGGEWLEPADRGRILRPLVSCFNGPQRSSRCVLMGVDYSRGNGSIQRATADDDNSSDTKRGWCFFVVERGEEEDEERREGKATQVSRADE